MPSEEGDGKGRGWFGAGTQGSVYGEGAILD